MREAKAAVAAVLLAAGLSSRYRAADPTVATKLVATSRGSPIVRHVALAALESAARPIVVVTGHADEAVAAALAGLGLCCVHNPDYATGLASSLRVGIAALPPDVRGALILLGDMPGVDTDLVDRLIGAFGPDCDAVVPVEEGRRGNPVLLGRALFGAIGQLSGDEGARRLLRDARVREIEAGAADVTTDIDAPDTLAALEGTA